MSWAALGADPAGCIGKHITLYTRRSPSFPTHRDAISLVSTLLSLPCFDSHPPSCPIVRSHHHLPLLLGASLACGCSPRKLASSNLHRVHRLAPTLRPLSPAKEPLQALLSKCLTSKLCVLRLCSPLPIARPHPTPYSYSKRTEESAPLEARVAEVNAIIKKVGTSMLTTVGTDGKSLHSRAMRAASTDKLIFSYIYGQSVAILTQLQADPRRRPSDNTSHKEEEVQQDSHVNIAYCEPVGGDWISIAGTATTTNDRDAVAEVYSAQIKAWFGDKGDGVHDGSASDPRVSVMRIKPVEIRYYTRQQTLVGQAVEIATSIFSRDVATPGKIRTITGSEVRGVVKRGCFLLADTSLQLRRSPASEALPGTRREARASMCIH